MCVLLAHTRCCCLLTLALLVLRTVVSCSLLHTLSEPRFLLHSLRKLLICQPSHTASQIFNEETDTILLLDAVGEHVVTANDSTGDSIELRLPMDPIQSLPMPTEG